MGEEEMTTLIKQLISVLAFLLVVFFYITFRRVAEALGQWMKDLPVWKSIRDLKNNDWVRALFIILFLQVLPIVLLLSFFNQWIRKRRGVYNKLRNMQAQAETSLYSIG